MFCFNSCAPAASIFCLVLGVALPADAATVCENLPPSKLLVYDLKVPVPQEAIASLPQRERAISPGAIASPHIGMVTVTDLVSYVEIQHRTLPRPDGSVCDAPEIVRIAFGASLRRVLMSAAAANDACVHGVILDHEKAHTQAFDAAVDDFLDQKRSDFEAGMKALKQTPSPTSDAAKTLWNKGVSILVAEAKRQLLTNVREANATVDAPVAIRALEAACNGRLRELERLSPENP